MLVERSRRELKQTLRESEIMRSLPYIGLESNLVGLVPNQALVTRQLEAFRKNDLSSLDLREAVDKGPVYALVKRSLDIVGGLTGLLLLFPVFLMVAAIIKLTGSGPVLYRHSRVGLKGQEFTCYKFRSMVPNADEMKCDILHSNHHDDDRTFKSRYDPRVTPFGRWLRRTSIDEAPQLWNVVKGDMSLVGPRPPTPEEVGRYTIGDMRRLMVKPGLTCIWQVSGRSELAFPAQLRLDLLYIKRRSLLLDLKLILLTIPAVLTARGAY